MHHVVVVDQLPYFLVAACRVRLKQPSGLRMRPVDYAPRAKPPADGNEESGVDELIDRIIVFFLHQETFVIFESGHVWYRKGENILR